MNVKAIGSNVFCVQRREQKVGSIILAAVSQEAKKEAEVISVGSEVTNVKVGDKIIFDICSGSVYKDEEGDGLYLFVNESDIQGVLEDKND